jgi:quinol monooxygenase YgiN
MAEIVIYVSALVRPEHKEKFENTLRDIVVRARQVNGCLKYQWLINPDDDGNYMIYGEFDTEESFLMYKKSDVVLNIGKHLLPLIKEKPTFKHFKTQLFEQG